MERETFAAHLAQATQATLALTRSLCWNTLTDNVQYLIRPDYLDEQPPHLNEEEKRCFAARKKELGKRLSAAEVVDRLWVLAQVPVWIDISVYKAQRNRTVVELLIDRRLRKNATDVYHQREGYPPFHILVSTPATAYTNQDTLKPTKFNVNWKHWPWSLLWQARTKWYRLISRIKHGPNPF
jgi:hypothetical protein